jgi:hypothetical protein
VLGPGQQALIGQLLGQPVDVLLVEPAAEPLGNRGSEPDAVPSAIGFFQKAYINGPRWAICPSPRRTRAAPSLYPDP